MTIKTTFTALAVAGLLTGAPAMAGNTNVDVGGGKGLVVVDVSNVAVDISNILNDPDITVQDITVLETVQVGIGIAANVCPDVTAAILAEQTKEGGGATCTADSATTALAQAVKRSINQSDS